MSTENIRQTKMAITTFSNVSIWNQHNEIISIKNTCYSVGGSDCYETFRNKTPGDPAGIRKVSKWEPYNFYVESAMYTNIKSIEEWFDFSHDEIDQSLSSFSCYY